MNIQRPAASKPSDGIAAIGDAISSGAEPTPHSHAYAKLVDDVRGFLSEFSQANLSAAEISQLRTDLQNWTDQLRSRVAPESERDYGRWWTLPNRTQATVPDYRVLSATDDEVRAEVSFSEFYLGKNGAIHGGAVSLFFDDFLGLSNLRLGMVVCRTAYLRTQYRAITPVGRALQARCWFEKIEGRKHYLRGEIYDGEQLCAEADGLFIALRPQQK